MEVGIVYLKLIQLKDKRAANMEIVNLKIIRLTNNQVKEKVLNIVPDRKLEMDRGVVVIKDQSFRQNVKEVDLQG